MGDLPRPARGRSHVWRTPGGHLVEIFFDSTGQWHNPDPDVSAMWDEARALSAGWTYIEPVQDTPPTPAETANPDDVRIGREVTAIFKQPSLPVADPRREERLGREIRQIVGAAAGVTDFWWRDSNGNTQRVPVIADTLRLVKVGWVCLGPVRPGT